MRSSMLAKGAQPPRGNVWSLFDLRRWRSPDLIFVTWLVLIATLYTWYGLHGRYISTDEGISLLAAEGIRTHGYPELPSGLMYQRAYLAHYLLAFFTLLFGDEGFGVMVLGLLAGVGILTFTYLIARRVFDCAWPGLIAVVISSASATLVFYSTGPRMYGPLAFFGSWAAYAGLRGWVDGHLSQRFVALVAVACGIQCERGTAVFVPVFTVFVLLDAWKRRREVPTTSWTSQFASWLRGVSLPEILGLSMVGASVAALYVPVERPFRPIVAHAGSVPDFVGVHVSPLHLGRHILQFEAIFPGTLCFAGMGLVACLLLPPKNAGVRYVLVLLAASVLQLALLLTHYANRYLLFLTSLYAPLFGYGLYSGGIAVRAWVRGSLTWVQRMTLFWGCAAGVLTLTSLGLALSGPRELHRFYLWSYGKPHRIAVAHPRAEAALTMLRATMRRDDVVLSTNPFVSYQALGRVDGFLRQRNVNGQFGAFDETRDEYFGKPIFDTIAKVQNGMEALKPSQTLWLYIDTKRRRCVSPEMYSWLQAHFTKVNTDPVMQVYRYSSSKEALNTHSTARHGRK